MDTPDSALAFNFIPLSQSSSFLVRGYRQPEAINNTRLVVGRVEGGARSWQIEACGLCAKKWGKGSNQMSLDNL